MDATDTAPGFMLISDSPLQIKATVVDETSISFRGDRQPTLSWIDGGFTRTAPVENSFALLAGKALHASRILVQPESAEYLFVRQETDDATCDFAFSLPKITGSGLQLVASNAYGCDL